MDKFPDQTEIEAKILEITRLLLVESGNQRAVSLLTPMASFDRDLGLGSLERVELLIRVEAAFSVTLPDTTIAEAETPDVLAGIVMNAAPAGERQSYKRSESRIKTVMPIQPARSITEAIITHAEKDPDRPHIYLSSDEAEEPTLTYKDLFEGAAEIASGLQEKGMERGEAVAIMLPTGEDFFYTFCGILLAGGIPVPVYPPFKPRQIEEYAARQEKILRNAGAVYLITFQKVETIARLLRPRLPELREVLIPGQLRSPGAGNNKADTAILTAENDPALIQYTSGSTGNPKGVFLTHKNLLSNIHGMKKAMQLKPNDVGVSWLPLYHDMGLIGSWLFCMVHGIPIAILSPLAFLSRPEKWLWTIHRHGGTLSAAPNFAYEICAKKIKDDAIEGLDLSSWRIALNGAEPVKPETLHHFTKRFSPYGFRSETHLPVYGMAEASVGLAFPKLGRPPRIDKISRDRFQQLREAKPAGHSELNTLEFVSCGIPLPEHKVRIVDENGMTLGERREGEIEFKGPSCTMGYYRNPESVTSLFHDGWLVAGDLGYTADGELFITGRKKDLIIKGGRNLHPHEIEDLVGEIQGVRKGCVAAFGIPDQVLGTEKLVVVVETRETGEAEKTALSTEINDCVLSALGVPADLLCLVPPGTVRKTSSGKIARSACREAYLKGSFTKQDRSVTRQFAHLLMAWLTAWGMRGLGTAKRLFYSVYLLLVIVPILIPVWVLVLIFPAKKTGFILRQGGRIFLKSAGAFPFVEGLENLGNEGPVIWVANHASYFDVSFLLSILPPGLHVVAKQELLSVPVLRTFLQKGGHITVDREDVSKGASEIEKVEQILKSGASVLIFPEGGFVATAGLRPFKLGAFKAAIETGTPVRPVSLRGTREFFRGGDWLIKCSPVTVTLSPAIRPKGNEWREAVRLRDLARKEISCHTDEVLLEK